MATLYGPDDEIPADLADETLDDEVPVTQETEDHTEDDAEDGKPLPEAKDGLPF